MNVAAIVATIIGVVLAIGFLLALVWPRPRQPRWVCNWCEMENHVGTPEDHCDHCGNSAANRLRYLEAASRRAGA